jgi:hypothetical protein
MNPFAGGPEWKRSPLVTAAFWLYAAALFTATHWPNLRLNAPEGSDKVIHCMVFGGWMIVATAMGWFGEPLSDRNLLRTLFVAAAYGGLDEGLQAIPFVHRTCALDDYAANAVGVMLAALVLLVLRRRLGWRGADQRS